MQQVSTSLPFPGFYESILSYEMDAAINYEIESFLENDRQDGIDPALRLDENELAEIIDRNVSYAKWRELLAKSWADSVAWALQNETGVKIDLDFEELTSPREYNFQTDRIFAKIPLVTVKRLMVIARRDNYRALAKLVSEKFKPYDGFIPFYSDDVNDWLEKPLDNWDHNEIGVLIESFVADDSDFDLDILESMTCNGEFNDTLFGAMANDELALDIEEARREKLAEALAIDPDFVPQAPRCPLTLNLPL